VEFVQIFSVTKYDQTFVGRQNSYSVREAVIYNISFTLHRLKEQQDASVFDACNLSNMKLYLNSDFYSVIYNLNLDFDKKRYAILFDIYARCGKAYYEIDCFETLLNVLSFVEKGPFAVIDCSRQNKSVKNATVDVCIKFDCKENACKYYSILSHHTSCDSV